MAKPRVSYTPRLGVTPEDEARVLALVYRFVLQAHRPKEKGARPGAPDDVRRSQDATHTAKPILP
jgi:hypothetical protein